MSDLVFTNGTGNYLNCNNIYCNTGTINNLVFSISTGNNQSCNNITCSSGLFNKIGVNAYSSNSNLHVSADGVSPFTISTNGTMTGNSGGTQRHLLLQPIMSPTTGITYMAGIYNAPSYQVKSGMTTSSVYGEYTNIIFPSSHIGTITNAYGHFIDQGSYSSGTISNGYGLYVNQPSFGSKKFGMEVHGNSAIGTTASTGFGLNIGIDNTGTTYYGIRFRSNIWQTDTYTTSGGQRGMDIVPTFINCAGASSQLSVVIGGVFGTTQPSQTINNCYSMYVSSDYTQTNRTGTISNSYGIYYDGGTSGTGTISNSYGIFTNQPAQGKNRYGLYCGGSATVYAGSANMGAQIATSMGAVAGNTINDVESLYIYPNCSVNVGTITNMYGILVSGGSTTTGTITNGYGMYVGTPNYGSNKYCAYFQGGVGIGTTPPTSAGLCLPTSGGTPSNLNFYEEWSGSVNFSGAFNSTSFTIKIIMVGKLATLYLPSINSSGNSTSSNITSSGAIPSRFRMSSGSPSSAWPCLVIDNGSTQSTMGYVAIYTDGTISIFKSPTSSNFTATTSTCGLNNPICVSYVIN